MQFEGEEWLYFPAIDPDIAIIRATTADERGNLTFEHEGAYLGAMELALAAHNCGGEVIAQVKRIAQAGTLQPHDVRVPGMLVDFIVEAPDRCRPRRRLTIRRFRARCSGRSKASACPNSMSRRSSPAASRGIAGRLGGQYRLRHLGQRSAHLLEEGRHGDVTWVIEQGAVGGMPLLDFKFGCSSNAEAFVLRRSNSPIFRQPASMPRCYRSCRSTERVR